MPGVYNPKKFLELAKQLLIDDDYDENSRFRTAMSRIYYAAFLIAEKKLEREGITFQEKSKIHQKVIDAYMDHGFTDIGDKLNQMRDERVSADYELMAEISIVQCKHYAQMSDRTIQLIGQITAFP